MTIPNCPLPNYRHELFCRFYVVRFNATWAAVQAGYSKRSAKNQGYDLLKREEIIDRVGQLTTAPEKLEEADDLRARVIAEYAKIAFGDIRDYYDENGNLKPIHELDDHAAASLVGVDVQTLGGGDMVDFVKKIKRSDKTKALDALGRHLGLFEKHEQAGRGEIHIHLSDKDERL